MNRVGEHVTIDFLGVKQEYSPDFYSKVIYRIAKKTKEKVNLLKLVNKKPITATIKEVEENPSSRSAKLRSAIKQEEFYDFETDILDKFKYLIDIEKYSQKL